MSNIGQGPGPKYRSRSTPAVDVRFCLVSVETGARVAGGCLRVLQ
jgi:hypothetical protein